MSDISAEDRQAAAKTLVEIRSLEDAPNQAAILSKYGCTVAERIQQLRASLPAFPEPIEASPAMAPPNIPPTHRPQEHSGIADYSDESHVGRIETASGSNAFTLNSRRTAPARTTPHGPEFYE
jgi:hypothetical protein